MDEQPVCVVETVVERVVAAAQVHHASVFPHRRQCQTSAIIGCSISQACQPTRQSQLPRERLILGVGEKVALLVLMLRLALRLSLGRASDPAEDAPIDEPPAFGENGALIIPPQARCRSGR